MSEKKPTSSDCDTCRSPKATFMCPLCEGSVCNRCAIKPPAGAFFLMDEIPAPLTHPRYCQHCYDTQVADEAARYEEIFERAREVFVFFTSQKKEIPLIKKSKEVLRVRGRDDRDETILRLAFMAAERDFNAVIETVVEAVKERNEGYQRSVWSGTAVPAQVHADRIR